MKLTLTLTLLTTLLLVPLAVLAAEDFTIEAKDFDDGNACQGET